MQQPQPQPRASRRKLIVLDVDDTLISEASVGQVNPPRKFFYPDPTKRILEMAKANPDVYVIIASKVSSTEEINSAVNNITNINHPHIRVFGRKDINNKEQYPKGKFSAVNNVIKELNIDPNDVIWVDDDLPSAEEAAREGYVPVLVPCTEEGALRTLRIESSSYLDCLPTLVLMDDKRDFKAQTSNLKISDKNRYVPDVAKKLALLYQKIADQYQDIVGNYVSFSSGVIRQETKTPEVLYSEARKTIKDILEELEEFVIPDSTISELIKFLKSIEIPITSTVRYMDEKTKTKISRLLEAEEIKNSKNPEVRQLSSKINALLDKPARVIGKMFTPLVSEVVKPATGADPLTRINFNRDFVYRRETGKPFPTLDARDGQDNLTREFAAANPENLTHSGFKIQGNHILQEDYELGSGESKNMNMSDYRDFINKKYLPHITPDLALQEWAKYNAHMGGPAASCVENLQLIFKNLAEQSFIMDMSNSSFNVYTNPREQGVVYFTARVPFLQAIEEAKEDIKRHEGEETRYPTHRDKGIRDPVAVFEITIKGVKTKNGVETQLVAENFACYQSRLLPAFNEVNKLIEQRRRFDHLKEGLANDINNFVSAKKKSATSTPGFFERLFGSGSDEGAEIILHIRDKINELVGLIKNDPMGQNYEDLTKKLLNFVIEEKQKYLAHPTSESGKQFRDVLDNVIDNYLADFKDVIPSSVVKTGSKPGM